MIAILPLAECHIDAIAALEKRCFSDPWSRNSIVSELNNEWSFWLVAVDGDTVAGYIGSQLVPPEADVMNLAVAPAYRRQGVGQSLLNAQSILRAAGAELSNVVKTTVFLDSMDDFAAMNEVYAEFFSQPYPARSAVSVKKLPKGALVEIEVIAAK